MIRHQGPPKAQSINIGPSRQKSYVTPVTAMVSESPKCPRLAQSGHLRRRRDPVKFSAMARALIDPGNSFWRNAAGVVAAAILIPIAIVAKLISIPFERPAKRTAEEVAQYLRSFLDDSGGKWDWDDFISIPLADPNLESIRQRASSVELPVTDEGRLTLQALLREAEAASKNRQA